MSGVVHLAFALHTREDGTQEILFRAFREAAPARAEADAFARSFPDDLVDVVQLEVE